jgi:hypothetical protein
MAFWVTVMRDRYRLIIIQPIAFEIFEGRGIDKRGRGIDGIAKFIDDNLPTAYRDGRLCDGVSARCRGCVDRRTGR